MVKLLTTHPHETHTVTFILDMNIKPLEKKPTTS